jgi:hypothetical protein
MASAQCPGLISSLLAVLKFYLDISVRLKFRLFDYDPIWTTTISFFSTDYVPGAATEPGIPGSV